MAKPTLKIVAAVLSAFVLTGCSSGTPALTSRLPANYQIGNWALSGNPVVVNNDVALYNQIDGGAAKYIDRGWVDAVFATYQGGDSIIRVAIHDMGNPDNAQNIFQYDLPASRVEIDGPRAVVDMGLPTSYSAKAYVGRYYIEVSIDDRSDAALETIKKFTVTTMSRCG